MGQIHNIEKLTDCKFLNLYHLNATSVHNTPVSYFVAYDGTRYKGWQVQKSTDDTIQGKLQHVLSTLAGKSVEVIVRCAQVMFFTVTQFAAYTYNTYRTVFL